MVKKKYNGCWHCSFMYLWIILFFSSVISLFLFLSFGVWFFVWFQYSCSGSVFCWENLSWLMTPSYYRVMQKSIIGILMSHYLSMTHQLLMYWNKITGKKSKVSTLLVQSTVFVWASVLDKCKIAETNKCLVLLD